MVSLLLDGPLLFPMLVAYLREPWTRTGVSPIAFAVVYNLCQLNTARLATFVSSDGLFGLQDYIRKALSGPVTDSNTTKLNLALALLYQIGSPKNGLQNEFVAQGGLSLVLDHFKTAKSVLVFLTSFITMDTPTETVDIVMNHPDFAEAVDSMYAESPDDSDSDSDEDDSELTPEEAQKKQEATAKTLLVVQVLRNLCLLQGSSGSILPLLPRFLGHNLSIADEAISALSNLAATQEVDFRYAWDSSLIGMVLSRATQICEKFIENASQDTTSAINNQQLPARKHVLTRVFQILRVEGCLKAAGESTSTGRPQGEEHELEAEDEKEDDHEDSDVDSDKSEYDDELVFSRDDAVQLVQLANLNRDVMLANQHFARLLSRYLVLLPSEIVWAESEAYIDLQSSLVFEKGPEGTVQFEDQDIKPETLKLPSLATPLTIVWRRLSQITAEKGSLPAASSTTITSGEIEANGLTMALCALARSPTKLATMFKLPSTDQSKWSSAEISVKLFHNKQQILVKVDDRVPCYPFSKPIGAWTGSTQTWLPLIEKAVAKLIGGYSQLPSLSFVNAWEILTGTTPEQCFLPDAKQFEVLLRSELSHQNVFVFTQMDDAKAHCLIDSISEASEGSIVTAYNPNLFDKRRGWDSKSGCVQLTIAELIGSTKTLYRLEKQ
jgi:hypothetical protein